MKPKPGNSFALATFVIFGFSTPVIAQSGVQSWAQRYNGPGNLSDEAVAVATDADGNVVVTGRSTGLFSLSGMTTIKYSSAGVPIWTNTYDQGPFGIGARGNAVAIDAQGNVFATGTTGGGMITFQYSSNGVPLWTNFLNDAFANATALDQNGDLLIAGGYGGDFLSLKYSGAGVPLWTNQYNSTENQPDSAFAIAVDQNANVFLTGPSRGSSYGDDFATIGYSSAGVLLWTNRFTGSPTGIAVGPAGNAVDANGNVFVTGGTYLTNSGTYAYATIKYSPSGAALWTNFYTGPTPYSDAYVSAIAVDGNGNVFVTGEAGETDYDYVTIKYSNAGDTLWINQYGDSGNDYDSARYMIVDSNGNVIVTGVSSKGVAANYTDDYLTIAYSGMGTLLWTSRYSGPENNEDYPSGIAVDGNGNVAVTGSSFSGTNWDYATVRYGATVAPPPVLNIQMVNSQLILNWTDPTFQLQCSPSLTDVFTNISGATSPYTNAIAAPASFFRLKHQP